VSVLSIFAVGRLAERRCREAGEPVPVEAVVSWLVEAVGVQDDRARAGVRLAPFVGRLEGVADDEGQPCLQIPSDEEAAA
jgi:hypothetical protein